jgi:hypothetical protein
MPVVVATWETEAPVHPGEHDRANSGEFSASGCAQKGGEGMIDQLSTLLAKQATDLINQNVDGFANELKADPEGKVSLALSFKVTLMRDLICSTGGLAYSRKFKDEVQGTVAIEDPQQPDLGLVESETVVIDAAAAKRIIKTADAILESK